MIIESIKVNIKVFVIFLLNMFIKTKMSLFYKYEYENKIFFSNNKLKFQPRT